jgi:hypothetical protein
LPLFNNKPGVYDGTIIFSDAKNIQRSPVISFRYIVAGPIATIQSVSTDKPSVKKGELVVASVHVVGTPVDITANPANDNKNVVQGTLSIELTNAQGEVVGTGQTDLALAAVDQVKQFSLTAQTDASSLSAKATVSAGGKIIATFNTPISQVKPNPYPEPVKQIPVTLYIVIIALIAAITLFILIKRNKMNRVALSIAIILVGAAAATSIIVHAATYTFTDPGSSYGGQATVMTPAGVDSVTSQPSWCQGCATLQMFINGLKNPNGTTYTLAAGNKIKTNTPFVFSGNIQYQACGNFPIQPKVTYSIDSGPTLNASISTNCLLNQTQCASSYFRTTDFITNSINFATAGAHKVHVAFTATRDYNATSQVSPRCQNQGNGTWLCPGTITFEADFNFTAVDEVGTPLAPTAQAGACGTGKIDVSWTAATGAQKYNVYDNTILIPGASNLPAGQLSFSHTGLANSSGHSYQVEAVNGSVSARSPATSANAPGNCPTSGFDYNLTNSGNIVVVAGGPGVNIDVTRLLVSGTTESVPLSVTNLQGLNASAPTNNSASPSFAGTKSTITITAPAGTPAGTISNVTVNGDSSPTHILRSTTFNVLVQADSTGLRCYPADPANPSVSINPGQAQVGTPVLWVAVGPSGVTYTWSGSFTASGIDLKNVIKTYSTLYVLGNPFLDFVDLKSQKLIDFEILSKPIDS